MSLVTEFLGLSIEKCRKERGISQSELAKRVGTSQSVISEIEKGKRNSSIDQISKICQAMGYSFDFKIEPIYDTC